ncbi:MAG: VWA domain-containing protein [Deltaproteobacteria bacterium]|nr:VWA domain-containing protein [Deltaproteobacteria bacterium]
MGKHTNRGGAFVRRALAAAAIGMFASACAPADDESGRTDGSDARRDDADGIVVDIGADVSCEPAACTAACAAAGYPVGTCGADGACSCDARGADADADADWGADADSSAEALAEADAEWGGDACVAENVTAEHAVAPVDIIWVVDSSGSMDFENHAVRDNLNAFSMSISASGIDHHVVLIGDRGEMDVPPPLGGSVDFLHIDYGVDSNEGLQALLAQYPTYRTMLRPGAVQHFVAVTDDESDISADEFIASLEALADPGFPPGWKFHSIVAQGGIPYIGCITGARIGAEYLELTRRTGGVTASVCQTDWSPIFAALEEAIGVRTELPCNYDLPDPPAGMALDPGLVNLDYTPEGGATESIPRVADPGACPAMGWYYDDLVAPTQILLCPETCDILRTDSGSVDVAFGCATIMM